MRVFNVGDEVLFYRGKSRVYGTLAEYIDDDTVVIDLGHRREVMPEMFVRDADDPDDPED